MGKAEGWGAGIVSSLDAEADMRQQTHEPVHITTRYS
jgi:hypothetical protein